jgi:hypothetical protein
MVPVVVVTVVVVAVAGEIRIGGQIGRGIETENTTVEGITMGSTSMANAIESGTEEIGVWIKTATEIKVGTGTGMGIGITGEDTGIMTKAVTEIGNEIEVGTEIGTGGDKL